MTRVYRKGGVGAMMDEYERAAMELGRVIEGIDDDAFERTRDRETKDESCRSIQTVMHHVIRAGYGYATRIRNAMGVPTERPEVTQPSRAQSLEGLRKMLDFTVATLDGHWEMTDDEITAIKMDTPWNVSYDLEQAMEHAIVHILRHRRQIERFLSEPQFQKG
jgi:uncharacterized damage-inducible protein DinB